MKIMMVKNELAYSGVPVACYNLSIELKKRGHEVFIISAQDGPMRADYQAKGIPVHIVANILEDAKVAYTLAKQVHLGIVHTLIGHNCVYGIKGAGRPVIWGIHEPEFGVAMVNTNPIMREALSYADKINFATQWSARNYGPFINRQNYGVVYTGTPINTEAEYPLPFERKSGEVHYIQLGSVEFRKGQDVTVNGLLAAPKNTHLHIVGRILDQKMKADIEAFAKSEKLNVHITGAVPDQVKLGYLQHCDGLIHATRDELIPICLTEAQAFGKIVVGSDVGAMSEAIVDGKTGFLHRMNDFTKLGEILSKISKDKDLRDELGANGKELYQKERSYEKFIESYIEDITRLGGPYAHL